MSRHEDEEDAISEIEGSSLFSDTDSEIVDSPADGYFVQRPHPQQFFTNTDAAETSKSQESQRPTQYEPAQFPSSSQPAVWATEQTPLLDAGPAPPDYYAATADRRNGTEGPFGVPSYGSIEEDASGHEGPRRQYTPRVLLQAGLFGSERPPQSMTAGSMEEESQTLLGIERKRRKAPRNCFRSRWTLRCANVLIFVLVLLAIVLFTTMSVKHTDETTRPVVSPPAQPTTPALPDQNPRLPHNPEQTGSPSSCSYKSFSESWHYDFSNLRSFSLEESLTSADYSLGGSIWVKPAPAEQIPDVRVSINYITSAGIKIVNTNADLSDSSVKFELPEVKVQETSAKYRQCIDAGILVSVKNGIKLNDWTLTTPKFYVFAEGHLFNDTEDGTPALRVEGTSTFNLQSGKLDLVYWSSRETVIETGSGTIHGKFALRDLIKITTTSGPAVIDVIPYEADPDRPLPATLNITTQSGMVRTEVATKAVFEGTNKEPLVPMRDYITNIESRSGSVTGSYLHGSHTSLKSRSGSIVADVLPIILGENKTTLITENNSGATSLRVESPIGAKNISHVQSSHDSSQGSGSILLRYPDEWTGTMIGQTRTGVLIVRGKGIEDDEINDLGFYHGKKYTGRKGTGNSMIDVRTGSGSIDLGIGTNVIRGVL